MAHKMAQTTVALRLSVAVFIVCLLYGDVSAVRPIKLSRVYALTKNIPYAVTSADIYNYTISTVDEEPFVKITLLVTGAGFKNGIKLRTTSILKQRGSECYRNQKLKYVDAENHVFEQMWANSTHAFMSIKLQVDKSVFEGEVFLCVNGPRWINDTSPLGRWIHQGSFGWLVWPEHPMILFTKNSIDLRERRTYKRSSGTEPPFTNQTIMTTEPKTSGHENKYQLSTNKINFLDETVWYNKTIKELTAFVTAKGLRCKFLIGGVKNQMKQTSTLTPCYRMNTQTFPVRWYISVYCNKPDGKSRNKTDYHAPQHSSKNSHSPLHSRHKTDSKMIYYY